MRLLILFVAMVTASPAAFAGPRIYGEDEKRYVVVQSSNPGADLYRAQQEAEYLDMAKQNHLNNQMQQIANNLQQSRTNKADREMYAQIFGEKLNVWNRHRPLSHAERIRLEHYMRTGTDPLNRGKIET